MYYQNYLLEAGVYPYMLTDIEKRILDCAIWILNNKSSIRKTCKEFMLSKSQLHRDLQNKLKNISYELYQLVCK